MCSRARPVSLAAVALLIGMATGAAAQDAARYGTLLDSLSREWRRIRAGQRMRDSLVAAGVRLDTLRIGPLTVFANPEDAAAAGAAARMAWNRVRPALGRDTLLAARRYYVWRSGSTRPEMLGSDVRAMAYHPQQRPEELAGALVYQLGQDLATDAGPLLWTWAGAVVSPLRELTQLGLRQAYRELVTSGAEATHGCLRGDVSACSALLLLHESELPVLVERPITNARRALMQMAVDLGGDGAYGRLVGTRAATVAGHLEAAAGVPVDSLLRIWHRAVVAARPRGGGVTWTGAWVTILWALMFGAITSRSSRWRFA